uniref:Uncharacterized protein n=1 Tax=Anguilla anguilla TaxID=7936 RepID=A0A0E9TMY3_ANGAN
MALGTLSFQMLTRCKHTIKLCRSHSVL